MLTSEQIGRPHVVLLRNHPEGKKMDMLISDRARQAKTIGNNLLRALKPADFAYIEPLLEPFHGQAGEVLYEPGDNVGYAYFPCDDALVSYRVVLADGRTVETALIGREGAVGGVVSQGRLPSYSRTIIQFSGFFYRLPIPLLQKAKEQSPSIKHLFSRYADCLVAQIFQATACNATHSIEERTAKWLLSAIERRGQHELLTTQEQLAGLLGVGRSYVSRVVQRLKRERTITTKRGRILIQDMTTLEKTSCDCNLLVRRHFEEVLQGVYPRDDD